MTSHWDLDPTWVTGRKLEEIRVTRTNSLIFRFSPLVEPGFPQYIAFQGVLRQQPDNVVEQAIRVHVYHGPCPSDTTLGDLQHLQVLIPNPDAPAPYQGVVGRTCTGAVPNTTPGLPYPMACPGGFYLELDHGQLVIEINPAGMQFHRIQEPETSSILQ